MYGNEALPALKLVRHFGGSDCWTLLPKGFSKYEGCFDDLLVRNECLSVEAKKSTAEFSYGNSHSTLCVWHNSLSHHTSVYTQYQLEKQTAKPSASAAPTPGSIKSFVSSTGKFAVIYMLIRVLYGSPICECISTCKKSRLPGCELLAS